MRPIRVLHAIPAFQMGGAERMIVDLFRTLEEVGEVEFELCVFRSPGYVYPSFSPKRAVRIFDFTASWRDLRAVRKCIGDLRQVMEEFQPDVLHTHLWVAHYIGAAAVRNSGVRQVCHIHNTWDWMASRRPGFRLRRVVLRTLLRRSGTSFIACSTSAGEYYRRHLKLKRAAITRVPYGIDVEVFAPGEIGRDEDRPLRIGTAGRFVAEKGHVDLFGAVAILDREGIECELMIAGCGPLETEYRRIVADLGVAHRTYFCGLVEDMPAFYRSLDLYVQPSWSAEGLPLSILEALSCGRPVIVTDVAGAGEAVRDGVCGYVVRPRDPQDLAAAIICLAGDAPLQSRFGYAARSRAVECYSRERMSEDVLSIYRSLVEGV